MAKSDGFFSDTHPTSTRQFANRSFSFHQDIDWYNSTTEGGIHQDWADQAGKLILAEADQPTEENIITSINLVLFWFSQGQWQRALVYESNSVCTSRILGLASGNQTKDTSLTAEIGRRRCWASFILTQFIALGASSRMDLTDFETVPLPCDEHEFVLGVVPSKLITLNDEVRGQNYYSELIRVGSLWYASSSLPNRIEAVC
jgi:hypothetical protein